MEAPKRYKKEFDYSYALGAYTTIELIRARPALVRSVYVHSDCADKGAIERLCQEDSIPVKFDDRIFDKVSPKENCYVLSVFSKYVEALSSEKPHIVLVNPGDMGNLGAIARIAAAFNIKNLGIVMPAADILHPRAVRASMGSVFRINHQRFGSFDAYRAAYPDHRIFPFMVGARDALDLDSVRVENRFALVFGNEASGLDPAAFQGIGTPLRIPQSDLVDSLNISVAVGIGAFAFAKANGLV